jgi:predicted membrane protein
MVAMNLPARTRGHVVLREKDVRERAGVLAVWSEQKREGDWSVPRNMRVVCVMASAVIDLREARIPEGLSTIEVFSLFGGVEIIAPPGVRIECDGDSLGGEFSFTPDGSVSADYDAPTIRLIGDAYFASVTGEVRYAGESKKEAKRRVKALERGRG